jgi:all-trans-retinol dehydrogenase (NAD+)
VCARIKAEIGDPTVLINNAGVCRGKTVLEETARDVELTFSVNTMAHFHLVRSFLPAMVAANHGHIVTVASIVSYVSAPQMVSYSASKAAAQALHEGLGLELKFRYDAPKVRTTLVSQGYVKTPLFEGFKDGGFLLPPLEPLTVAEAVVEKVFSQESGHVVLPRAYNLFTGMRGWPTWRQVGVRAKTHDVMSKWEGKQVLD